MSTAKTGASTSRADMSRAKKPKAGRPSLSGKGYAVAVLVKVAPTTRDQWQAFAAGQNLTVSEMVRESVELAIARGSTR